MQRRALDPFFTTRRNEGGTGLGLHIIFNLVTQQLGGRLTFESRLGWGTRFRICIPRVAPGECPPMQTVRNHGQSAWLTDDIVHLIDDPSDEPPAAEGPRWKVAVIDDEPAVHDGTRFALSRLQAERPEASTSSRPIRRPRAASSCAIIPDVAVVLLDVIMESDTAGLDLVEFIRKDLKNDTVRIILRTGQPGQAPERRVIVDYDINDYKAKTELTADKLFTALTAALRSHQQLQRMVETRRGLEIIIEAASTLFDFKSMQRLAEGVLTQIASLLNVDCAGILVLREAAECARDASRSWPARAATAASSAPTSRKSSSTICDSWWRRHSRAASHEFSGAPLGALHQDA